MTIKAKLILVVSLLLQTVLVSFTAFAVQEEDSSLLETGLYQVGVRMVELTDESRNDRVLTGYIWYPALVSEAASRPYPADDRGAPYPLIIYSHGYSEAPTEMVSTFTDHLVSHGFVVVELITVI